MGFESDLLKELLRWCDIAFGFNSMIRNEKVQDVVLVGRSGSIIKITGFVTWKTEVCRNMNSSNVGVFFPKTLKFAVWVSEQTVHYTVAKCSEN